MADPGAIRVNAMLDASPFLGGISGMVGGLSQMSNALKVGSLALGYFTFKTLKEATKELIAFEMQAIELKKVMGGDIAEPIIEEVRRLSLVMPVARQELLAVAATAARLGVRGKENILKFTEVVAKIGIATDVSAGHAAEALARLAKQTKMPIASMEGLGAAINQLDNTMATSSAGIIDAASRSAAELSRLGFTVPEILALNASLAEVSESASRAGTRLNMLAQEFGNPKKAEAFGEAIGITGDAFTKLRRQMPLEALRMLIDVMAEGGDVADDLASNVNSRVRRALQQYAQNIEGTTHALKEANIEFVEMNSLNREYGENLALVNSKQVVLQNNIDELQTKLGEALRPALIGVTEAAIDAAQALNDMFDEPLKGSLTKSELNRLRDQLYNLWDDQHVHRYFGTVLDHTKNLANLLLDEEYQFETWHSANKEMQEDILSLIDAVQAPSRPAFFQMITEELDKAQDELQTYGEAFANLQVLAGYFAFIDTSEIADDRVAMEMFKDETKKVTAAFIAGTIEGREYVLTMNAAADIARLNAHTLRERNKAIADATKLDEEQQKAVDKLKKSLQDELNELTLTEEALFKLSEGYIHAIKNTKGMMLTKWRLIQQLEEEKEAWEELKKVQEQEEKTREGLGQAFRDEEVALANEIWARREAIAGRQDYNRALLDGELILKHGYGERRDRTLQLYDEARALEVVMAAIEDASAAREKAAKKRVARAAQVQALLDKYSFATFESQLRLFERVVGDAAESIVDTFDALVTGSEKAGEAVVEMIADIAKALLQAQIQKMLFEAFGPLFFPNEFGGIPDAPGPITGVQPPQFARGGRPKIGELAIVGERGPELFIPDAAGTVVPNDQLGGATEVTVVHNFNINALDGASVRDMLAREQKFISGLTLDTIQRSRRLKRG